MRDANRARGSGRGGRGGADRRNGPSSDSRASRRSDPYARPARSQAPPTPTGPAASSHPPPELSIRGSSGPTWIIVSNLVVGTSNEDVRLTFSSFGRVDEVKQRPAPSPNHPTVSFEVAFDRREDAEMAVQKFNGALADGRILQVSIKKPDVPRDAQSQFNRATAQAVSQRPKESSKNMIPAPAAIPYTPTPAAAVTAAIPTGPASMRSRAQTAKLVEPRAKKSNAPAPAKIPTGPKAQAKPPTAPKSLAQRLPEPLANRLLTPQQAEKVRAEEKKKAERAAAIRATGKHTVLGKRLGGLPLAQRLVQQAGTPKSDQSAIKAAAEKKRKRKEAAKAKAKARGKGKGKAKAGEGMDLS